jgi:F0F1-type ATP synthase membrane subunit b/b'
MVEIPDSVFVMLGIGIPILAGFVYFTIARKDKSKFDTQVNVRGDEEAVRDKEELARKVKKELTDEAEKVEKIRKDVAIDVKEETNAVTDQKIREQRSDFDHKIEMYEQRVDSKFTASDKVMSDLMGKMVNTAQVQADALSKINESIEALRKLFYEMSGKINRVEREQDKQAR